MPLTQLQQFEAKGIQIMREVLAETDNPVRVYAIGKDSAVRQAVAQYGVDAACAGALRRKRRH